MELQQQSTAHARLKTTSNAAFVTQLTARSPPCCYPRTQTNSSLCRPTIDTSKGKAREKQDSDDERQEKM
jgi:hypothetical protein